VVGFNCNSFDWPHFFDEYVNAASHAEKLEEWICLSFEKEDS
jgi:hypothetical protein